MPFTLEISDGEEDLPFDVITIEEASARLHLPVETLYAWDEVGFGPNLFEIGDRHCYFAEDIEAFISELTLWYDVRNRPYDDVQDESGDIESLLAQARKQALN